MGWFKTLNFLRTQCSTEFYGGQSAYDPKWAEAVKVRDNYKCQLCNNTSLKKHGIKKLTKSKNKILQAHHILYRSKYPELRNNLNNGITLCKWCHEETHKINSIK